MQKSHEQSGREVQTVTPHSKEDDFTGHAVDEDK